MNRHARDNHRLPSFPADHVRLLRSAESKLLRLALGSLGDGIRESACRALVARLAETSPGDIESLTYRNGSIVAFTVDHVIKVPIASGSTGWREPAAWAIARQLPAIEPYVVTGAVRRFGPAIALVTPRHATPASAVDEATATQRLLSVFAGAAEHAQLSTADLPELGRGLRILESVDESHAAGHLNAALAPLLEAETLVGPMHGDLHAGNVVLGPDGPRLVDCGELRARGAHLFDVTLCAVERASVILGAPWTNVVVYQMAHSDAPLTSLGAHVDLAAHAERAWLRVFALVRLDQLAQAAPHEAKAAARFLARSRVFSAQA